MAKWFYYNESGEKIEVTVGQLKGLAKAGTITPGTIIETEEGKSSPARNVKGLTFTETSPNETAAHESTQFAPNVQLPTEPKPFVNTPQFQTQEEKLFTMAEQKMIGDFCTRFFPIFGHGVQNVNASRETLLHAAVKEGNLTIVRYLVSQGADVNAMNNYDQSPL
jgi:hypothetical protein